MNIENKLEEFAVKCLKYAEKMHRTSFLNDVRELWKKLTKDRGSQISSYFRNPSDRRAYLGYYFPMYVAKITRVFQRLEKEGQLQRLKNKPLRLLDLGSGTLTGVAATKLFFENELRAHAIDKSLAPMRLGLKAIDEIYGAKSTGIFLKQANLLGPKNIYLPSFRPNLIFLGHVLNEIGQGPRALAQAEKLIHSMMSVLDEDGLILIIEPASQPATRFLMSLRDRLASASQIEVVAPCTGAARCPLLQTKSSWCFSEFDWQRPKAFERIDRQIGFKRETLKSSYLLLSKHRTKSEDELRIVSGPMKQGSTLRRYLCTKEGRKTLELSQVNEGHSYPHRALRGELLDRDRLRQKDKVRIYTES